MAPVGERPVCPAVLFISEHGRHGLPCCRGWGPRRKAARAPAPPEFPPLSWSFQPPAPAREPAPRPARNGTTVNGTTAAKIHRRVLFISPSRALLFVAQNKEKRSLIFLKSNSNGAAMQLSSASWLQGSCPSSALGHLRARAASCLIPGRTSAAPERGTPCVRF